LNLMEGLRAEITRNEALLNYYKELPDEGWAVYLICSELEEAHSAILRGDIEDMVRAYTKLKKH